VTTMFNLEEKTAQAVCYIPVFGVLPALVFLVGEKNAKIKWQAWQAVLLWVTVMALDWLLETSIVLRSLIPAVNLAGMIALPLVLLIKASSGESVRLPMLGELIDKITQGKKI
jgi:uncharacterized membrane protein